MSHTPVTKDSVHDLFLNVQSYNVLLKHDEGHQPLFESIDWIGSEVVMMQNLKDHA